MLKSQIIREKGPEVDPLWLGKGLTPYDLSKPQILIESTYGDSHPGSKHLNQIVEPVKNEIYASGCAPSVYTVTDMCDGVATGHEGMNYSLVSRELIAGMLEIHAMASGYDGIIAISSCDKAVPGQLMAIARLNIPAIHIPGGSMAPGPGFISADSCYETDLRVAEGTMTTDEEFYIQCNACPSCGACQYMGTASTMQCLSEALGLAMPGAGAAPANSSFILQNAQRAAHSISGLIEKNITPDKILTKAAFINAIRVHAAIGGSANAVLHLPAIAKEAGIELNLSDFDKYTKDIPLLTSLLTAGKWPTQYFWYAGGIPRIMKELAKHDLIDTSLITVTGKTVGENLKELEKNGYFRRSGEMLKNMNMLPEDIIKTFENPADRDSGVTILKGNLAEGGAVIKHCAVDKSMYHFLGRAKVFDDEESAVSAIYKDEIKPGDVVVIRYVGKKAAGMPEMLKATDAICNKPALATATALVTDGRFSGASRGPCVGYLLPEAAEGGAIAYLKDDDLIEINIENKSISIAGINKKKCSEKDIEAEFERRKKEIRPKQFIHKGVLKFLDID